MIANEMHAGFYGRGAARAYRRRMAALKFRRAAEISAGHYVHCGAHVTTESVGGRRVVVGCYVRYPNRGARKRFLKKASSACVRKTPGIEGKGNLYRRAFDYKWSLD